MPAPRWWRYAIPNVVTCVSLLAGLLSISSAAAGDYRGSAWFILLSVLLDKLDGAAARLLRGSSKFGLQMDSLTDLIVFGVAPAVLVLTSLTSRQPATALTWFAGLHTLTYIGTFWYVIAAALRLAKFNVVSEVYGSDYFFGIPTTLCGALVATSVLVGLKYPLLTPFLQVMPAVMFVLGLLMVCRLPLPKLKPGKNKILDVFIFGNVALIYVFGFARLFPEYLFVMGLIFLFGGLAIALGRGIRPPVLPRPGESTPGDSDGSEQFSPTEDAAEDVDPDIGEAREVVHP